MDEFPQDYEVFDLGDVTLQHGATLRDAKLAYKTYGELNADKSNAIVYPTWYSGRHWDNEWLIGEGMALDPANYFIIVPNMLGNRCLSASSAKGTRSTRVNVDAATKKPSTRSRVIVANAPSKSPLARTDIG